MHTQKRVHMCPSHIQWLGGLKGQGIYTMYYTYCVWKSRLGGSKDRGYIQCTTLTVFESPDWGAQRTGDIYNVLHLLCLKVQTGGLKGQGIYTMYYTHCVWKSRLGGSKDRGYIQCTTLTVFESPDWGAQRPGDIYNVLHLLCLKVQTGGLKGQGIYTMYYTYCVWKSRLGGSKDRGYIQCTTHTVFESSDWGAQRPGDIYNVLHLLCLKVQTGGLKGQGMYYTHCVWKFRLGGSKARGYIQCTTLIVFESSDWGAQRPGDIYNVLHSLCLKVQTGGLKGQGIYTMYYTHCVWKSRLGGSKDRGYIQCTTLTVFESSDWGAQRPGDIYNVLHSLCLKVQTGGLKGQGIYTMYYTHCVWKSRLGGSKDRGYIQCTTLTVFESSDWGAQRTGDIYNVLHTLCLKVQTGGLKGQGIYTMYYTYCVWKSRLGGSKDRGYIQCTTLTVFESPDWGLKGQGIYTMYYTYCVWKSRLGGSKDRGYIQCTTHTVFESSDWGAQRPGDIYNVLHSLCLKVQTGGLKGQGIYTMYYTHCVWKSRLGGSKARGYADKTGDGSPRSILQG